MRLQKVQEFVVAVLWPNRLGTGFEGQVAWGWWLVDCSHKLGKRDRMANSGWRGDLCSDTHFFCHSSGKLGNTPWFHYELILAKQCYWALFHSLLLNVFEHSSEKPFLWTFLLLLFLSQSQDAALQVDLIMLCAKAFCYSINTVNKTFLRSFCCLWCWQRLSHEEAVQAGRLEEKVS